MHGNCRPGPSHRVCTGRRAISGALSAGTRQRNAHNPEKRGSTGETIAPLTTEWMPDPRPDGGVRRDPRHAAGSVDERELNFVVGLRQSDATPIELQHALGQGSTQQVSQVGAMSRSMTGNSIEAFAFFSQDGLDEQHRAIAPTAKLPGGLEPNGDSDKSAARPGLWRGQTMSGRLRLPLRLMQPARLLVNGYVDIRFAGQAAASPPSPAPTMATCNVIATLPSFARQAVASGTRRDRVLSRRSLIWPPGRRRARHRAQQGILPSLRRVRRP